MSDWSAGDASSRAQKAVAHTQPNPGQTQKTGTYKGKSNDLGHGGRAQQLKDQGVPQGVIGMIAREKGAAPGGKNYHGGKK